MYVFKYFYLLIGLSALIFQTNAVSDMVLRNNSNYQIHGLYQAQGCAGVHSGPGDWGVSASSHAEICNDHTIDPGSSTKFKRKWGQTKQKLYVMVNVNQDDTYPAYKQNGQAFKNIFSNKEYKIGTRSELVFPDDFTSDPTEIKLLKYIPALADQPAMETIFYLGGIDNQTQNNFLISNSDLRVLKNQKITIGNLASQYATTGTVTFSDNVTNSLISLKIDSLEKLLTITSALQIENKPVETRYSQLRLNRLTDASKLASLIEEQYSKYVKANTVIVTSWYLNLAINETDLGAKVSGVDLTVGFIDTNNDYQYLKLSLSQDWLIKNDVLQEETSELKL